MNLTHLTKSLPAIPSSSAIPSSITLLASKINSTIKHIHSCFNQQYEWNALIALLHLLNDGEISITAANQVIEETVLWIECAAKFIRNIYVLDATSNIAALPSPSQILRSLSRELQVNLNHVKALFLSSQPSYILSLKQNIKPPLITTFPLNVT